jgi:hypothetical protein
MPSRTAPRRLIWCSSCLAAKGHASTHSPCCASLIPSPQAAPTVRPGLRAGVLCCHAFCFGCVIRHGSSCVLHPASFSRHSLHFILFHSLSITHARFVWVICSLYFSPLLEEIKRGLAHNHNLHSLPTRGSFHSIPFRSFLFHSASCSPPAAIVVLACACRTGCGLSCFLHPCLLADARPAPFNNQPHKSKKSCHPLFGAAAPTNLTTHSAAFLIVRIALL